MAQIILHPREGRKLKDYALFYLGLGWRVFPVWNVDDEGVCACSEGAECGRPGKHPIGDLVPAGVSDATDQRAKVEAWWGNKPRASIGIATGSVSGITVIDADVSDGKPGLLNLTRLFAERGGVPPTFRVNTGSGGIHLYFKYEAALQTGTNVLAEAIDVRNDGGYIIAPPSGHYSGGTYSWAEEKAELAKLPSWILTEPQESATRRRGRPRSKEELPLDKTQSMLTCVDPDDRDVWLKIGLILGRSYVGTASEGEAWAVYESWAARSNKFDQDRAANVERMREHFYERSQDEPREGSTPMGIGSLIKWAREGGWTPFGEKATIEYSIGNEDQICNGLIKSLIDDPETNQFYNIGGEVRKVSRVPITSVQAMSKARMNGEEDPEVLVVRKATVASMQHALYHRAVLFTTSKQGVPIAKSTPDNLISAILQGGASGFPALTGIVEWPMVMGGRLLMRARGYDKETGLYFEMDEALKIEKIKPKAAWAWIKDELLIDFPFVDEVHQAGALAMMLCMMQRPLMRTAPAFAVVAPQPGTGKSTLIEMAGMAIHGSPIVSHSFSEDEEEIRKALHSLMLAKIPLVLFDNIGRGKRINSDHLAKLITSETTSDRVLGSSETSKEVNTLLMTFTGNNISFVKDMASRVIVLRLNAKSQNPLERQFKHSEIRSWAVENRSKLLSCLIAIAQLSDRGSPFPPGNYRSRFEDYDRFIVKPVIEATGIEIRSLTTNGAEDDAEEEANVRESLGLINQWQQQWRDAENGKDWRVRDLVFAIEGRAFSEQQMRILKTFMVPNKRNDEDPSWAIGYALRNAKDNHQYYPYIVKGKSHKDGTRWSVENIDPECENFVAGAASF